MAGVTIRWCSGEASGVALGASGCRMNTREWEVRCCVVKISIQPVVRVVAHRAVNRVLLGLMVLRSVILNLMTSDAISRGIEYCSFVARRALGNSCMSAGQFKASSGMVKCCWLPASRRVTSLALNR